jgi:hypothetical protein
MDLCKKVVEIRMYFSLAALLLMQKMYRILKDHDREAEQEGW